jgi:hypothetical protein
MPITTGLRDVMKQVAADAVCPSGAVLKCALIKVGATGTYDANYGSAYVAGLGGDEVAAGNGYTQGGVTLGARTAGPSGGQGWVDYPDAVWTAVGQLSAIGAVIYDSTNANRIVGFVDFGGTKTATDDTFTVRIPGDGGNGLVRIT